MGSWNDVFQKIKSQEFPIDVIRKSYIKDLSDFTNRNVISYYSGWLQKPNLATYGYGFEINDADKMGFMSAIRGLDKTRGLDIILHTPGGIISATESIIDYLKSIFRNDIRAIVPQLAMSAGTMMALSCKEIIMGKHSSLGPIDPHIHGLPAHGIIEEFENAKKEIAADYTTLPLWQIIISKYNPTLIGECHKSISWSENMVKKWLTENMFKDDVNPEEMAQKVIDTLGSHAVSKAHDRHYQASDLRSQLNLKIINLEDNQDLQDKVLSLHHASIITLDQTQAYKFIENSVGIGYVQNAVVS
jgi:membrane-bound ClpP family serine protease